MKTPSRRSMITSSRRVSKRASSTRQSSFLNATLRNLMASCRFLSPRSIELLNPFCDRLWRLIPKQDFLVCFFGGNLLLSATLAGGVVSSVSVPPRAEELSDLGRRDWTTGIELIRTCMATHETKTYVPPFGLVY